MSNAELIERLRHNPTLDLFADAADALEAADKRIAELECRIKNEDFDAKCKRASDAERKLAVAREALKYHMEQTRPIQKTIDALAQIGGDDAS